MGVKVQGSQAIAPASYAIAGAASLSFTVSASNLAFAETYSPIGTEAAFPSLQDELDFYVAQGWVNWSANSAQFGVTPGDPIDLNFTPYYQKTCPGGGNPFTIGDPDVHYDSEGPDLWTYLHQYDRYGDAEYQCFADAWADYWINQRQTSTGYQAESDINGSWGLDHMWAWDLVTLHEQTPGGNSAAITAARAIVADAKAWWVYNKGDGTNMPVAGSYSMSGIQPRRAVRLLYAATRLAQATGDVNDIAFRDTVLDLWLQSPGWEEMTVTAGAAGMHFLNASETDSRAGANAYASGSRVIIPLHIGLLGDAYYYAHHTITDTAKRATIRDQAVKMGRYIQEFGLLSPCNFTGIWFGHDVNLNPIHGFSCNDASIDPVYTLDLIGILMVAFKWTGDTSFITSAIEHFKAVKFDYDGSTLAQSNEIHHFMDTEWLSNQIWLKRNRGELQYVWRLFENGANDPAIEYNANDPSWLTSANEGTWVAVGNPWSDVDPESNTAWTAFANPGDWDFSTETATYHDGVIENWNGAVARDNYLVIGFCGGHHGSQQNTIFEFGPFTSENPKWNWFGNASDGQGGSKYDPPSHKGTALAGETVITNWQNEFNKHYYSDGKPSSAHMYDNMCYIPDLGGGVGRELFAPRRAYVWRVTDSGVVSSSEVAAFKFNSEADVGGSYLAEGTHPNFPDIAAPAGGCEYDPYTGLVWCVKLRQADTLWSFNPQTNTWSGPYNTSSSGTDYDTDGITLDPGRRIMLVHDVGSDRLVVWDIDTDNGRAGDLVEITTNYTGPLKTATNIGFEYEPVGKTLVGYNGGSAIYKLDPPADYRNPDGSLNANASWTWVEVTNGAGGATPSAVGARGTYGRFRYISSIKAFAVINNPTDQNVWVYRVPAGGL